MDRKGMISMKGRTLTLTGRDIRVGDNAPDFTVLDGNLSPFLASAPQQMFPMHVLSLITEMHHSGIPMVCSSRSYGFWQGRYLSLTKVTGCNIEKLCPNYQATRIVAKH